MRQATAWIAAIGLLGAATTAAAQDDRIYGGVFGQYVVPDAARDSDDGAGGGALIGIPLNPWFALEVNAQGYIQQQGQNPDLYDRGGGLGLDLLWGGNSAYHKRPYLLIGGGVLFEEIKLENYTSGYANIGAGVRIRLFAHAFAVRAEARGLAIFNDRAIAGEDTFLDAHARLGFEYPFGGRDSGEAPGATATVTAPGAPAPSCSRAVRWTTARQSTGLRASSSEESDDTAPGAASSSSSETANRYFSSTFDIMLLYPGRAVDFEPPNWLGCLLLGLLLLLPLHTIVGHARDRQSRLSNGYSSTGLRA